VTFVVERGALVKVGTVVAKIDLAHPSPPAVQGRLLAEETLASPPTLSVETPSKQSLSSVSRVPMSRLRKTIAAKLVSVKNQTAMLTTFNEVDMSAVMGIRAQNKQSFEDKHGTRLGIMPFFVKATLYALQEFPILNARIEGDDIVYSDAVHMGIAVGTEKGLFVPVLKDVASLSFADIERRLVTFAKEAKEGTLSPSSLQGGTFSLTNGGVFGSLLSTPILNPPQSGILGMHNIVKRAVVIDDQIVIRPMMYLALSYDHRIVDGRESISFLLAIKKHLEDPSKFFLT
jgi:2-oxoglutarate dehydrogenase E2 component (dihydrolipoamide succinyltransferase)